MQSETGAIHLKHINSEITNPSFLVFSSLNRCLYSVSEHSAQEGTGGGFVAAFRYDERRGDLEFLNKQPSQGDRPCYLCIGRGGRHLLVSNYSSGTVAVLPVGESGCLHGAIQVVKHTGSSINPVRQKQPHPHSVILDDRNERAFVPDLGIDRIMMYDFDDEAGKLYPAPAEYAEVSPGAGPRHMIFHPGGKFAYVINELNATITSFKYERDSCNLSAMQTVATLPGSYSGDNFCGDIKIHPSGKFLYGSNRGHDSIVVFRIGEGYPTLALVQFQDSQGKTPRNFAIDPSGRFLVAANQDSNKVVVFSIDPISGELAPAGHVLEIPAPVCPTFLIHYN